jgi:uncharacterized protein RhaS with RHS repeats
MKICTGVSYPGGIQVAQSQFTIEPYTCATDSLPVHEMNLHGHNTSIRQTDSTNHARNTQRDEKIGTRVVWMQVKRWNLDFHLFDCFYELVARIEKNINGNKEKHNLNEAIT